MDDEEEKEGGPGGTTEDRQMRKKGDRKNGQKLKGSRRGVNGGDVGTSSSSEEKT